MLSTVTLNCQVTKIVIQFRFSIVRIVLSTGQHPQFLRCFKTKTPVYPQFWFLKLFCHLRLWIVLLSTLLNRIIHHISVHVGTNRASEMNSIKLVRTKQLLFPEVGNICEDNSHIKSLKNWTHYLKLYIGWFDPKDILDSSLQKSSKNPLLICDNSSNS